MKRRHEIREGMGGVGIGVGGGDGGGCGCGWEMVDGR
jgi:hypothetical protein